MNLYHHLLFATDLLPDSEAIGIRAKELAQRFQARLSLLSVVELVPLEFTQEIIVAQAPSFEADLRRAVDERLTLLANKLDLATAPKIVLFGSPRHEIAHYAREHNIDLIVMGKHSRHGFARLLGSTAESVVRHATCDVLTIAQPEAKHE